MNIYKIFIRGNRTPGFWLLPEKLKTFGIISEVVDESRPSYDLEMMEKQYSGTLIGDYIRYFPENNRTETEEKALYYGIQALMETGRFSGMKGEPEKEAGYSLDLERSMQMLKMSRKGYLTEAARRKKDLEKEKEKISANIEYIRKEIRELDEKRDRITQQQDGMNMGTRDKSTEDLLELRIDRVKRRRELNGAVLAVVLLAGIAGTGCLAAFSSQLILSILTGVLTAGITVAALFFRVRLSRELNRRERQRERWLSRHDELTWNRNSLDSDHEEKHTALSNLQAELQECEENTEVLTPEETEIQALNMAMETIEALSGNITDQVGVRLKQRTSQILSEITGGKYREVLMDEELHMSVNTGERTVSIERLSRGTLEQIYFALRMAAGELFCKEEPFPVILDDVFGMYDEERLAAALRWLHKEERQVIISTCHKREMEILDKEGIPYQKLLM